MEKEIYNEFIFWLYGIIEDDPIPVEIKSLVFYLNNNCELGFSGSEEENIKKVDLYFYYPLEAEFFYSNSFNILLKTKAEEDKFNFVKLLLKKLKTDKYFKQFNIFLGKLFFIAEKI